MSKQRATSRHAGHGPRGACLAKVDSYNIDISPQVKSIIDVWEMRLVNNNIARDIDRVIPNHYWIVKNMMGLLMEEMLGKGNNSKLEILKGCIENAGVRYAYHGERYDGHVEKISYGS